MPSKTKLKNAARSAALPSIPKKQLDQFVTGPMTAEGGSDPHSHNFVKTPKKPGEPGFFVACVISDTDGAGKQRRIRQKPMPRGP